MKKISMSRTRCRNENIIEVTNEDFKVSMLLLLLFIIIFKHVKETMVLMRKEMEDIKIKWNFFTWKGWYPKWKINWMGMTIDKTVKNKVTINVATQEKKNQNWHKGWKERNKKKISIYVNNRTICNLINVNWNFKQRRRDRKGIWRYKTKIFPNVKTHNLRSLIFK